MHEKLINFEELITRCLKEGDAQVKGSEIVEEYSSVFVKIYYSISAEYAKQENLCYKDRILKILLQRGEAYRGMPIIDYTNSEGE